jgi:predicted Zn-dependent protease with MMP-like domain
VKAPSLLDLEILAGAVFAGLPEKFHALCEGLVIRVEDFADDDVLNDMEIDDPFALLGLFHGVGLPFQSDSMPVQMPNMIWLYRRPILDCWAEHDETFGAMNARLLLRHSSGLNSQSPDSARARRRKAWRSCSLGINGLTELSS